MQVAVMAGAAKNKSPEPGRIGINLPWVQIEDCRLPLSVVYARDAPPRPLVRKNAEVAASGDRHVQWAYRGCRCRQFDNRARGSRQHVRVSRGHWNPISIVPN